MGQKNKRTDKNFGCIQRASDAEKEMRSECIGVRSPVIILTCVDVPLRQPRSSLEINNNTYVTKRVSSGTRPVTLALESISGSRNLKKNVLLSFFPDSLFFPFNDSLLFFTRSLCTPFYRASACAHLSWFFYFGSFFFFALLVPSLLCISTRDKCNASFDSLFC